MPPKYTQHEKRPSLREEVMDLDKTLLGLLLRRYNLLTRLRGSRGHLIPTEEKSLRESWQKEAQRFSADPKLSSELFRLLGEISFYEKPRGGETRQLEHTGFNLAPAKKPVQIRLTLPSSHWHAHAWLVLAAFSGADLFLEHCLLHDPELALIRALGDFGAKIVTRENTIHLLGGTPCTVSDLSLHAGTNMDTFALLAGQYLVRPSRIRFTAEGTLKTAALSTIAHFLPSIGARLSFVVPKTNGFPIRIESSGDLPQTITVQPSLPTSFVKGLLMALPFAEHPVSYDLADHPEKAAIFESCLPLLEEAGAEVFEESPWRLKVTQKPLTLPAAPNLPCDRSIACTLAGFPLLLGGEAILGGHFPSDPESRDILGALEDMGLRIKETQEALHIQRKEEENQANIGAFPAHEGLSKTIFPLFAGMLAGLARQGKKPFLPEVLKQDANCKEFFSLLGLTCSDEDEILPQEEAEEKPVFWNAPSSAWALALALAACTYRREGFKLGNAGIITELWPRFWNVYNALPLGMSNVTKPTEEKHVRRKIRTTVEIAVPKKEEEEE